MASSSSSSTHLPPPPPYDAYGGQSQSRQPAAGSADAEHNWMSRPVPPGLPCPSFAPITLSSSSTAHLTASLHISLDRGIYSTPAFGDQLPPPLPLHDVSAQDWSQFWDAMKKAADLSIGQRVVSGGVPFVAGLGVFGLPVTLLIEHGMKKKKVRGVMDVVSEWNERFFRPRRVDVFLMKGDKRVSGPFPSGLDTLPMPRDYSQYAQEAKARENAPFTIVIAPFVPSPAPRLAPAEKQYYDYSG